MIIQSFRSEKLPKILEIQQIRKKTTSFTMSPCKYLSWRGGEGEGDHFFRPNALKISEIMRYGK